MMTSTAHDRSTAAAVFVAAAVLLAACESPDADPAAPALDGGSRGDAAVMLALTCGADVAAGHLACGPPAGLGAEPPSGASGLIVGGQNTFVTLESSNACYEDGCAGGSPGADIFQADVTVENLIPQALATADGESGHADGVRIFFHSGPVVTGGSGDVTVANADGTATFTGTDQPYFQYGGSTGNELGGDDLLSPDETSDARTWRWNVPESVETFDFTVYVSAAVQHPDGWVEVTDPSGRLDAGGTEQLEATVYDVVGREVDGRAITWSTGDDEVATVDASGLVTGGGVGLAEVTASSDGSEASGSRIVNVDVFLVDADATGAGDGLTWVDAYTDLPLALNGAGAGDQVWVAEGTYYPTGGTDRTISFTVVEDTRLYGGFAGGETRLSERDWAANRTVLSGNIGAPELETDNSFHVVQVDGDGTPVTAATVIDGFTITGGYANSGVDPDFFGGGLQCYGRSADGGCSPRLQNLFIVDNYAQTGGGGMSTEGASDGDSSPEIVNVVFSGNTSGSNGGGLFVYGAFGTSSPTLDNVTLVGNVAGAAADGGAIHNNQGEPILNNSVLWGNSAGGDGDQVNNSENPTTVANTIIQGGVNGSGVAGEPNTDGGGNLDADPLFVDADGADDIAGTLDDDLRLQAGSPAIDAGDESLLPLDLFDMDGDGDVAERLPLDLDGDPRVVGADVDMGAYERQ